MPVTEQPTASAAAEMFTRDEAAEYLGVQPQTLAVWACTGRYGLKYIKYGRTVRYRRSDLDAFISEHERTNSSVE